MSQDISTFNSTEEIGDDVLLTSTTLMFKALQNEIEMYSSQITQEKMAVRQNMDARQSAAVDLQAKIYAAEEIQSSIHGANASLDQLVLETKQIREATKDLQDLRLALLVQMEADTKQYVERFTAGPVIYDEQYLSQEIQDLSRNYDDINQEIDHDEKEIQELKLEMAKIAVLDSEEAGNSMVENSHAALRQIKSELQRELDVSQGNLSQLHEEFSAIQQRLKQLQGISQS